MAAVNGSRGERTMVGTQGDDMGIKVPDPGDPSPTPGRRNTNGLTNPTFIIYGTNESYSGRTVEVGGYLYTTVGGAYEGNSYQLVTPDGSDNFGGVDEFQPRPQRKPSPNIGGTTGAGSLDTSFLPGGVPGGGDGDGDVITDNNPVVRLFTAPPNPRYRRSDNNQLVPIGAKLHQHADGTIMTEHGMGPQDNSVVVTQVLGRRNLQNQNNGLIGGGNGNGGNGNGGNGDGDDDGGGGTGGGIENRQLNPGMGSNIGNPKGPGDELPGGGY